MRRHIMLLLALLVSPATAPAAWSSGGGNVTVTNVLLDNDEVYMDGVGIVNSQNCTLATRVILGSTAAQKERFLSVAMTALASGLKVDLWVQECTSTPWGTAAVAYYLNMHR